MSLISVELEECRLSRLVRPRYASIRACLEVTYSAPTSSSGRGKENTDNALKRCSPEESVHKKRYRSRDERVKPGACLLAPAVHAAATGGTHGVSAIPLCAEQLVLKLFYVDEDRGDTVIVGKCSWGERVIRKLINIGSSVDTTCTVMSRSDVSSADKGAAVGRIACRVSLRMDNTQLDVHQSSPRAPASLLTSAVGKPAPFPHFEFQPLSRLVDWVGVARDVDIDDLIDEDAPEGSDALKKLFVHAKHLSVGATVAGRGDEGVHAAFQAQQLTLQYLQYGCNTMRGKAAAIEEASRSFALEERSLDSSIAQLKARTRLLQKQSRSLDRQREQYDALFASGEGNAGGEGIKDLLAHATAAMKAEAKTELAAEQEEEEEEEEEEEPRKDIDSVYTLREYNRLHPAPVSAPVSTKTNTKAPLRPAQEEAAEVVSKTPLAVTARAPSLLLQDSSDSGEDVLHIVAARKALSAPSSPEKLYTVHDLGRAPTLQDSSTDDDRAEQMEQISVLGDLRDMSHVSDATSENITAELPIQLSWLPPKHDGSSDPATATSTATATAAARSGNGSRMAGGGTTGGGWVAARVRTSLGSTAMSQDSLNPVSQTRPQTAQTAMSVDSLAPISARVHEAESAASPAKGSSTLARATSDSSLQSKGSPLPSHFPRDWADPLGNAATQSMDRFSGDDYYAHNLDNSSSMVNANVTLEGEGAKDTNNSASAFPTRHEGTQAAEAGTGVEEWNDVSITPKNRNTWHNESMERSPEQIAAVYKTKKNHTQFHPHGVGLGDMGTHGVGMGDMGDLEGSAFDVSIDNDEDCSPGMPALSRFSSSEQLLKTEPSLEPSLENSLEAIGLEYDNDKYEPSEGKQDGSFDISHISSPTMKNNSQSDSDAGLYSRHGDRIEEKLGSYGNPTMKVGGSAGLHILYTEDDMLAEEKPYVHEPAAAAAVSKNASDTDLSGGIVGSRNSAFGNLKGAHSAADQDNSAGYGNGSFYDDSIDDYMGGDSASFDHGAKPTSMYAPRAANWHDSSNNVALAPRGSTYNSQESLHNSSFNSSFHASPGQSSDRLDAFSTSPATATSGFRDESKSSPRGNGEVVSYIKRTMREDKAATDLEKEDTASPGMRTQVLHSIRGGPKDGSSPDGGPTGGPTGSYATDYGYGTSSRGGEDDGVLMGTAGFSTRSNLGSTASASAGGTGGWGSTGGDGESGAYNSVDRLKGLLGSSADIGAARVASKGTEGRAGSPDEWEGAAPASSRAVGLSRARDKSSGPVWLRGRAQLSDIEEGSALDVLVSAVRLNQQLIGGSNTRSLQLQFSFLGQLSDRSEPLDLVSRGDAEMTLLHTQYAAQLGPGAEGGSLRGEISGEEEAVSVTAFLRDPHTGENIGHANINLWMMIEDSVNIFRHEIDVYSLVSSNGLEEGLVVGSIFVDVRGYRMLLNHYTM